jgi:hypothetical protein
MKYKDVRNKPVLLDVRDGFIVNTYPPLPATEENIEKLMSRKNYGDIEIFVDVWDCKCVLVVGDKTEEHFKLGPKQLKKLEDLKMKVIYDDNNSAINWSGRYYPAPKTLAQIVKLLHL